MGKKSKLFIFRLQSSVPPLYPKKLCICAKFIVEAVTFELGTYSLDWWRYQERVRNTRKGRSENMQTRVIHVQGHLALWFALEY